MYPFRHLLACLALFHLILPGCSSDQESSPDNPLQEEAYVETGDVEALRARGALRILTPRHPEGLEMLPRSGLPKDAGLAVAEAFARQLGLEPVRVYMDSFDELIPALLAGKGDLIADNLTVTEARQREVAFSVPVAYVREQLVGRRSELPASWQELDGRRVAVHASDSFMETLLKLKKRYPEMVIDTVPEHIPTEAILEGVADGHYDLTVADSNFFQATRSYLDKLEVAFDLSGVRNIAWAVRPKNGKLLDRLNGFLGQHQLAQSEGARHIEDLPGIAKRKVLRVLTRNNAATYFLWRGELLGFEYELAKRFADAHGLRLEMVVAPNWKDLITWLREGKGDLVAASLTINEARTREGVRFSRPYNTVSEIVVSRADDPVKTSEDLAGRTLVVRPSSSYWQSLEALRASGIDLRLEAAPEELETEEIIAKVATGDYDLTVADSHIVDIELTWREDIRDAFSLGEPQPHGWAVREGNPQLLAAVNAFLEREHRSLFYNLTYRKYFQNTKRIRTHVKQRADRVERASLSPWDDLARRFGQRYGFDWRLLVAQMYQESRFDPNARSWVGARGLMQVMPRTARELGFEDLRDPETGLHAGVKYLAWLMERFEPGLSVADRAWFALASYNAGVGHVHDARRLARELGLDPNRWFDNVEKAMLLLSKRNYARGAKHGYVRGQEPVDYVRQIRDRYRAYAKLSEVF